MQNVLTSVINQLLKLPQEKIAKFISAILLIYIAYVCAQLTWMLVPNAEQTRAKISAQTNQSAPQSNNVNITQLISLHLFGLYSETAVVVEEKEEVQDAPETRLNLTLAGVVATDSSKTAAAIIENSGKQETYGIGETIKGTRATLDSVFSDRVLIKQSGRLETLMLDGINYQKNETTSQVKEKRSSTNTQRKTTSPRFSASPNIVDQRHNRELSQQASSLKEDINNDPGKITDYLRISPQRKDGKIAGYRLMPGKDPAFFKSSGLKSGDMAIQMNGYDLTIPTEAAQALQALKQESEVSLLVDRKGDLTEILFNIAQ